MNIQQRLDFINYCLTYYGIDGIVDLNATTEQVETAVDLYARYSTIPVEGNTFDREGVREILEAKYGLGTPDEILPEDMKWMLKDNRLDLVPIKKVLTAERLGTA
jgi:hypothetical protein